MDEEGKLSEAGRTEYTDSSRKIYRGSCIVYSAHIAADGAVADCQIYDGESANGELKVHLEALTGTTESWLPGTGSRFDHGIAIVVNAATTKVSITFKPVANKYIS